MSNAFVVVGLDFKGAPPPMGPAGREERCLVGEEAREMLFIEESMEGVKGVFASERARAREGVLGWLCILVQEKVVLKKG